MGELPPGEFQDPDDKALELARRISALDAAVAAQLDDLKKRVRVLEAAVRRLGGDVR